MINNENLPNKKVGNILSGHLQHPEEVFQNNLFLTLKRPVHFWKLYWKAFKAFIKPFQAPQRGVKIKI